MNLVKSLLDIVAQQIDLSMRDKKIVIFGAGENGLLLGRHLKNSNIEISCYCDNNPKKQQEVIDGISCISLEELIKYKKDTVIFISINNSQEIRYQLNKNDFHNIIPWEFIKILRIIPNAANDNYLSQIPDFGHYYSLYPNIDEIMVKKDSIFNEYKEIRDIDLNEKEQVKILNQMSQLYSSLPQWPDVTTPLGITPLRYRIGNLSLSLGDAVGLHSMLRILKPKKMIEVGSGFTSAVTLDTNEFYLDNSIEITFIEPYPEILKSVVKHSDTIKLIESGLQDVSLEVFGQLESGDILFIDSTHVSKINSDVNYLFFEIFPILKEGVYIHLHDIFYPFEYPRKWIEAGMIWNELYLLRAFLQNNKDYSIVFYQNMMEKKYSDIFLEKWPFEAKAHGGSIWLRKEKHYI